MFNAAELCGVVTLAGSQNPAVLSLCLLNKAGGKDKIKSSRVNLKTWTSLTQTTFMGSSIQEKQTWSRKN